MRRRIALLATAALASLAIAGFAQAAMVTVVHGVPDLAVDVYVNGELTLEGFQYESVTDPLELPAGDYEVAIRPAGAPTDSDPVLSGSATVGEDTNASIVAHLDEGGDPTLTVFVNDTSTIQAGDARLTVRHTAAAPAVDVLADGAVVFSDLANPDEQSTEVPAGTYSVSVAATGTTEPVIGPLDLPLDAGTAYFAYAVGSVQGGDLNVLVQTISSLGGVPAGVPSGTAGLAATSGEFPLWGIALLSVAGAGVVASVLLLSRSRREVTH
jgi:hypothetical protein